MLIPFWIISLSARHDRALILAQLYLATNINFFWIVKSLKKSNVQSGKPNREQISDFYTWNNCPIWTTTIYGLFSFLLSEITGYWNRFSAETVLFVNLNVRHWVLDFGCCQFSFLISFLCCLGIDFHWYRLDHNKLWSHKPGATAATKYDGDGNLISDPRKAAMSTIDYKFVSFMKIFTNIIDGPRGPHASTK